MTVTAVTGDIGAGKSTAAKIIAHILGCECINADVLAKTLWALDDVKAAAVSRWGRDILDSSGNVILAKIAGHVFSSSEDHEFCNNLLHPLVMSELKALTRNINASVLEIPLLPEAGRPEWIDFVVYVSASFEVRAERCRIQRGWSVDELLRRESYLMSRNSRISISDYVIQNEGSLSDLKKQAVLLLQERNITHEQKH